MLFSGADVILTEDHLKKNIILSKGKSSKKKKKACYATTTIMMNSQFTHWKRVKATNNMREKASWMKSVELNPRTNA